MNRVSDSRASVDRELVARFLGTRDEQSFRTLYRAHTPALLLLASRMTGGNAAQAEDAVQEAWLRAVRGLAGFCWESSLRTWLCGIAVNCSLELNRREQRSVKAELPEEHEPAAPPMLAEAWELEALVRKLPDGYREVLVLHDVEGFTHEEIGRLLGINVGTSKSQLSRARGTLRAWLNGRPRTEVGRQQ